MPTSPLCLECRGACSPDGEQQPDSHSTSPRCQQHEKQNSLTCTVNSTPVPFVNCDLFS